MIEHLLEESQKVLLKALNPLSFSISCYARGGTEHVGILNASSGRLWRVTLSPHAARGTWKTPLTQQHNTENLPFVKLF